MRLTEHHIKKMAQLQEMKSQKWVRGMNIQFEQKFDAIREKLEDEGIMVVENETDVEFVIE